MCRYRSVSDAEVGTNVTVVSHRVCLIAVHRNVCLVILYTSVFDMVDL
jgi:hypothetical protein